MPLCNDTGPGVGLMRNGVRAGGGVLCILGTRPEAIKLAPVARALAARGLAVTLCNTGQQRDIARAALADFDLTADVDLDLMQPGQTPASFVAAALPALAAVIARLRPVVILVQGDTASAFVGAMAAAYARIPLGHVEAGLRSHDAEPFPEDLHRRLIAQAATFHFAPTVAGEAALLAEGIAAATISVTGNPVIDAVRWTDARLANDAGLRRAVEAALPPLRAGRPLLLVTAHRRENHARMPAIAAAVATIAAERDVDIVVPVHPNPAAGAPIRHHLAATANVTLVAPLGYHAFVSLLRRARVVLTDSGGIQEEAPAFGCPVLVLRDTTERPEGVAAGAARLVGTDPDRIVSAACSLLDDAAAHRAMAQVVLPYGDGRAGERIADIVAAATT